MAHSKSSELKVALKASKLLSEEQKQHFLETVDTLDPEKVKEALTTLKGAEQKHLALLQESHQKKMEIQRNYLADLKRLVPKVAKQLESSQRTRESGEAAGLLSQLDNV